LRTGVPLNAVAFSPNQDRVAAGGEDGRLFLWPWPSRDDAQKPRALTPQKASPIHSLAFSPNGRWLLSTEAEGAAHMWDVVTGREQALPGHRRHAFDGTFGPQGEWMVTVGDEGVAKLWPTNHAREPAGELRGHSDAIASVAVRSDGRWIATAGRDGVVCLWDPPLGRRVAVVEAPALAGAFRDVGGQVLVVDGNFGAWAYDSRATGNARTLDGTPREGVGAISPDGRLALAQNPDGKVQIIDLATGQGAGAIVLPGEVSLAVFSSDSKWVVAAGTNDVPWLIFVRDHTLGPRLPMVRGLSCATFAGGSRFLLTMGDEGVLRVWNVPLAASGAVEGPLAELRIEGEVAAIACPDDDETLVALAIGRRTEIRNWRSRQPLAVLEGHEEKVNAVRFGPAASRFLVTASGDRTARLWNWREERTLGVLAGHAGPVLWVAFDSKGEAVLTGTQGGEVRSYDLPELNRDQQQVVALARSRLTRGFSDAERRSYHLAKPR
ncbi:MAG: WD40 repeat domain-containing protein, partial [Nitrospira sp.]|nr:WD40 repeat domain-containing protein [Nitrospira sp.]